jgi:hypothetical protein
MITSLLKLCCILYVHGSRLWYLLLPIKIIWIWIFILPTSGTQLHDNLNLFKKGRKNYFNPATFYWRACTPLSGMWAPMSMCVWGIDVAYFLWFPNLILVLFPILKFKTLFYVSNNEQNIEYVLRVRVVVLNVTFNNISVISWRSVFLVEETGVPGNTTDLPQVTDNVYHIMLNRVHLAWTGCKSNYHEITTTATRHI